MVIFSPPYDGFATRDAPRKRLIEQGVVSHKKGAYSRYKPLESNMSPSPIWHVSGVNLRETADAFGCAMALCAARTGGCAMPLLYPVAQAWDDATAEGEGYAPREHQHGSSCAPRAV